jgi:hypothetical protein
LTRTELNTLNLFLFGPRWQPALARARGISVRAATYWNERAVLVARKEQIAELVRAEILWRIATEQNRYDWMVKTIASQWANWTHGDGWQAKSTCPSQHQPGPLRSWKANVPRYADRPRVAAPDLRMMIAGSRRPKADLSIASERGS